MAKSYLRQFTQVSGSRTYDDTFTMANAETDSAPNLEKDLNYVRTQLKVINGTTNWYDVPADTISGIDDRIDNLTNTYLELTDTYVGGAVSSGTYTADNMLYTSASGVHDTDVMTYDPDTGDIRMGADGGARVMIDADSSTTIYGDDDSYIVISGTGGAGFGTGGDLRMSLTDEGLALAAGARVNEIQNVADGDTIDATSTDTQLATSKLIWNTISGALDANNEFIELEDTPSDYTDDAGKLLRVNAGETAVEFEDDLVYDGTTFNINGNVGVSGTFGFDAGTTVNEIVVSIDPHGPGSDDQLATEKAIWDLVSTLSGSLDEFTDLTDTPDSYAGSTGYVLTVNGTGDGVTFTQYLDHNTDLDGQNGGSGYWHVSDNTYSGISSDGTTMTVTDTNFVVDGTFGFGDPATTTVTGIRTSIRDAADDDSIVTEKAIVDYFDAEGIWELVDTPTDQIRPKIAYLQYGIYTEGNVTIGGDLTVTGTLFYADVETVQVTDNIMHINHGEVGAGVTAGEAGILVDRGSETDYMFVFDEGTDTFRVGVSGTQDPFNNAELQPVATREDDPLDHRVTWWDGDYNTLRTQGDTYITVNSGTDTIEFAANNTVEVDITTSGLGLKTGPSVNDIDVVITAPGDDISLATTKAIVDYVGSEIDDIDHNDLNNIQGGDATNRWHLDGNTYSGISSDGTTMTISQALNVDGNATFDVNVEVAGDSYFGGNVTVTGTFGFDDGDTTVTGIHTTINEPGSDDALATEKAIVDYVGSELDALTLDHNTELTGLQGGAAGQYFHLDGNTYSGISSNGTTMNITDTATDIDGTLNVDGATTLVSTLDVTGNADFYANVNVSGTFGFDDDANGSVNEILNSVDDTLDATSTDDQLATGKLIWNTISGALDTKDEFIELDDTPAAYTPADGGKLVRVNDGSDAVIFETGLTYSGGNFVVAGPTTFESSVTAEVDVDVQGNLSVSGTLEFGAGDTSVNEVVITVTSGSTDDQLPTAGAVWDLIDLYDPHTHYELDLTYSGSNVWNVNNASVEDLDTNNMDVYLNGLLNRDHADYFTASVAGTKLTVTFAYNTYTTDWAHVKFLKITA